MHSMILIILMIALGTLGSLGQSRESIEGVKGFRYSPRELSARATSSHDALPDRYHFYQYRELLNPSVGVDLSNFVR